MNYNSIQPTHSHASHADAPEGQLLTSLMQRLVRLIGAPAAIHLARNVPRLVVDLEGNVLDYDRNDPGATVRLLIQQYELTFGEIATTLIQQATGQVSGSERTSGVEEIDSQPASAIRIVVVDDHVLVREGLVSLIDSQADFEVVGQAGSVREAIAVAARVRPDLVLMDFTLPDGSGDEATRAILQALPDTRIVFLTVHDDDERLFAAISAGAMGYLLKSVRSADLLNRLRGVIRGDVALSPSIGRRILEELARLPTIRAPKPIAGEALTKREIEILRLIAQGHTNRQIADALTLSIRTVEYHRANLMSKLGFQGRADLVRYAAEHGLLARPDPSPHPEQR